MNGNEPAFPIPASDGSYEAAAGLTKREYFAAMAMQSILRNNAQCGDWVALAKDSVSAADALIAELNKTKESPSPTHRSCPVCGGNLERVRHPDGHLGDWLCISCNPFRYFLERDGKLVAPDAQ
jgi:hypothetical protein